MLPTDDQRRVLAVKGHAVQIKRLSEVSKATVESIVSPEYSAYRVEQAGNCALIRVNCYGIARFCFDAAFEPSQRGGREVGKHVNRTACHSL